MLMAMKRRHLAASPLLTGLFIVLLGAGAAGQVASLGTPDPGASPSPHPGAADDPQDSMLSFSGCMREHGIDLPDPQFGMGAFFASGAMDDIDMMSREFLDAFGACQSYLAAAVPAVDPEEMAERNERAVAFAECMREHDIDWPDPDPISGMTFSSMRGEDGGLVFDPFDPAFQEASRTCADATGASVPGMPGG